MDLHIQQSAALINDATDPIKRPPKKNFSGCLNGTFSLFFFVDGPVNNPAQGDPGLGTRETWAVSTLWCRAVSAHHSRAPSRLLAVWKRHSAYLSPPYRTGAPAAPKQADCVVLSVCFPANKQIKRRRFGRDEHTHQRFSGKHAEISTPGLKFMWLAVISGADTLIQVGVEAFPPEAWWCTESGAAACDLFTPKQRYSRTIWWNMRTKWS